MFTLVPSAFFDPESAAAALAEVGALSQEAEVKYTHIPQYSAVLVYCDEGGTDFCIDGCREAAKGSAEAMGGIGAVSAANTAGQGNGSASASDSMGYASTSDSSSGASASICSMAGMLGALSSLSDYNKILCQFSGGTLYIAIAQGKTLLLANSYSAGDFTTAQYYIFLAVKSLQINPEVSTIYFRSPLNAEDEMSLYRYFKSVVQLQESGPAL